jgi:hypothetical protein
VKYIKRDNLVVFSSHKGTVILNSVLDFDVEDIFQMGIVWARLPEGITTKKA